MDPELEQVKLAKSGDQGAFAALVRRYQGMVYNLAYARLGDAEAAADAAQETFLRAWRGLSSFSGRSAFSTWLYTIAYRTSLTMVAHRPKTLPLAEMAEPAAGEESDPEAWSIRREEEARLRAALDKLSAPARTALILYHFHDRTYEEISRIMGEPMGTVRTRLHRGRAKLKILLAQGGSESECAVT